MPYKSKKQAAYLRINKPEVAKKFEGHAKKGAKVKKKVKIKK